jgi:PKD repeat protein
MHVIPFTTLSTDGTNTWTNNFSITAHAPVIGMGAYQVLDPGGNNNGRLDPGETVSINIYINNAGSSDALNVNGQLISVNPYVTVSSPSSQSYGDLAAGTGTFKTFQVVVSAQAPQGQTASFLLEISADQGLTATGTFHLVIGKTPVLIVDYDGNENSGPLMKSAVDSLGLIADYTTTAVPDSLSPYSSVFVCLGVYPFNHVLDYADGQKLADFLNAGGRLYMEGGDTWKFDPPTVVHLMFNILALNDGAGDLDTIQGYAGTFTEGMSFIYNGDNAFIDRIAPQQNAFSVFSNQTPAYDNAIANDAGSYKTIGSSFEFGGLTDGSYPSTKTFLMKQYLSFFGIQIPLLTANFIGYPTEVNVGGSVEFTDFSTGGITSRNWTFPGGTPSSSTDPNPLIVYNTPGVYDVQLIVGNGITTDTLLKPSYIKVDYPTGLTIQPGKQVCSVVPNPNNGRFSLIISAPGENKVNIILMNSMGSVVYTENNIHVNGQITKKLNIANQPDGLYFAIVRGNNLSTIRKVIILK